MEQFPIILIPPVLRRVKADLPPLPPFPEQPPTLPKFNTPMIDIKGIVVEFVGVMLVGLIFRQLNEWLGTFLLIAGLVGVAIHAWIQSQTYAQRLKDNGQKMESYYQALADYSQKEVKYEEAVTAARSPEKVREYQYPRILKALERTVHEDGQQENPKINSHSAVFAGLLQQYFPHKIHSGLSFNPVGLPAFVMDFAYIDPALNLRIDIEVDEPYNPENREPLHFLKAFADESWNQFFLNKGWIVIRFSVQQVMKEPASCCKVIAQELYNLLGDPSILQPFEDIPDLQPIKRWTQQEAQQMATTNFLAL